MTLGALVEQLQHGLRLSVCRGADTSEQEPAAAAAQSWLTEHKRKSRWDEVRMRERAVGMR